MLAVSPEHSMLSNMYNTHDMAYPIRQCFDKPKHAFSLARAFTALANAQNESIYGIFYHSLLRQALRCVQSRQSIHCSRPCTKWANIWHFLSVNSQTSLSMHPFLSEPSLLSHMHKNGCVYDIFYLSMLRQDLVCVQSRQSSHCSSPLHKMGVHMAYSFSECSDVSEHGRCLIRAFAARTLTNVCRQIIRLKLKSLNPLGSCL